MMMVIDTLGKSCMRYIRKIEHNDIQIYLGFLFNIYTKIKYEDE